MNTLEDCDLQARKELVGRVISSNAICKSARLRELFLYLCNRVLDESIDDIHELELGHKVFGRPEHYDTASDNIVRVHASLLRKRLAEHFQTDGINESIIVEIPRGNYAPIFRKRDLLLAVAELPERKEPPIQQPDLEPQEFKRLGTQQLVAGPLSAPRQGKSAWKLWAAGLFVVLAALSAFFLVRRLNPKAEGQKQSLMSGATVRQFWSGIFHGAAPVQVVLDDASLDFYQEVTGHPVALAEYFDRSYLFPAEQAGAAAHLDPKLVHSFLLKRQSNFADVNLVGRLLQAAGALGSSADIQFARDFSFRQIKSGNIILLGTRQSNPWIQQFDSYLAVRWKYDPELDSYYPVDTSSDPPQPEKFHSNLDGSKTHEGYASVAFFSNPGGTGNILIISGTGGAAIGAAIDFLNDEASVSQLRLKMNAKGNDSFPYFETLLKVEKGASLPRYVTIVLCRTPQVMAHHAAQTTSATPR